MPCHISPINRQHDTAIKIKIPSCLLRQFFPFYVVSDFDLNCNWNCVIGSVESPSTNNHSKKDSIHAIVHFKTG